MISTQDGKRLEPKDVREALKADKTLAFTGAKDYRSAITKLLVGWYKDYHKRWKNNPKSVEGDAFAALALENYIRDETSWSARQSNFTASAFDSHADASSV